MSGAILPNEVTTEYITQQTVENSRSIQQFLDGLDSEQQRRFHEIAHHMLYIGFTEGQQRPVFEPTIEQQAQFGVKKLEIMNEGASIARDISDEK